MHGLIYETKEAVDTARITASSLSLQQRAAFEERHSQIIETGMEENPSMRLSEPIVKRWRKKRSKAKNLLDRCQKYRDEIVSLMNDFTIPFSNNQAERDIRMVKLQQKIPGTFRSEDGVVTAVYFPQSRRDKNPHLCRNKNPPCGTRIRYLV